MYELTCHAVDRTADRKDQAIGRVVALLPLLPVKELDALADRLHQKIRANPGTHADSGDLAAGTTPPQPASVARQRRDRAAPNGWADLIG